MLKKEDRLRKNKEIEDVFQHGLKAYHPLMLVKAKPAQSRVRLAVIAGKKVSNLAVDRNRAKRLVRAAFREYKDSLKPADIIVVCQKSILQAEHRQVSSALKQTLKKLKLFGAYDLVD